MYSSVVFSSLSKFLKGMKKERKEKEEKERKKKENTILGCQKEDERRW